MATFFVVGADHQSHAYEYHQCEEHGVEVELVQPHSYGEYNRYNGLYVGVYTRYRRRYKAQGVVQEEVWQIGRYNEYKE